MIGDYICNVISQIFTPTGALWALVVISAIALIRQIYNGHISILPKILLH